MTLALLLTAVGGAWADDTYTVVGNNSDMFGIVWEASHTANDMTKNGDGTYSITYTNVYLEDDVQYQVVKNHDWDEVYPTDGNRVITIAEAGTYTVTIHFNPTTHEVYETMPGSGSDEEAVEVTTNAAEEGATFSEASFDMPAFDATAEYELVRDMGYKVAFSGVPTRARLAKDGDGKFHFADALTFQLLDNIDAANPKDITSAEGITFMVGEVEAVSGMITLFQGYEVTVPAGEFATFYKDEPLYADPVTSTDAKLYTIASVSADKAVLSSAITTAPSLTPLLVYNAGEQDNTFLLIPANAEPNEAVTVAPEFVGTLEATTIAASTEALNNYALNGKQFVWVMNAIEVAANKCWLQIPNSEVTARNISIVFGDATGVNGVIGVKEVNDDSWYDLSGRKVTKPTKKGVYILNGKKVVVK